MSKRSGNIAIVLLVSIFAIVLFRTAWVCDDAFITLRTVDNFVNGYGLTWNVTERVQAYTHPLWMFCLALIYIFSGNGFVTAIGLSISVSLITLIIYAIKIPANKVMAILGILALLSSKFYIDYSTSGLENPLTHLLLALFFIEYLKHEHNRQSLLLLSLYSSLILVTRIDAITLVVPIMIYRFWKQRSVNALGAIFIGAVPFFLWELFSVFYYGAFLPNTAFAKLNTGIAKTALITQGTHYFEAALRGDYLLVFVLLIAVAWGLKRRNATNVPIVLGIILYMASIIWAGGCFMGGRFFTGPLLVAVIMLTHDNHEFRKPVVISIAFVVLVLGLIVPGAPLLSGASYGADNSGRGLGYDIDDHRYLCFQTSGLYTKNGWQDEPNHDWVELGRENRQSSTTAPEITTAGGIGYVGFYSGPRVHIVDVYALADPLLSRMPSVMDIKWRAGHFRRAIPDGYLETISNSKNVIDGTYLAAFYDTLSFVIKGPIADIERNACAVKMAFGGYDYLLEHVGAIWLTKKYEDIITSIPEGTRWWSPSVTILPSKGVRIKIDSLSFAGSLNISLDNNDDYVIRFFKDKYDISDTTIKASHSPVLGLAHYTIAVPTEARKTGFNTIFVIPVANDEEYALGHLRLIEE
ncbi:MAG: hypothetical protein KAR42_10440 [candidate division Zixibacteria bacterium]|nr:hypothetical protein [candidate division Zixibacteria bacterium]